MELRFSYGCEMEIVFSLSDSFDSADSGSDSPNQQILFLYDLDPQIQILNCFISSFFPK
jgi:hypothetical protein